MTCWGCGTDASTDLCTSCVQLLDGVNPVQEMDFSPVHLLKNLETAIKNLKAGSRFRLERIGWGNNYGDKTGVVVEHCGCDRTVVKWDGEKQEHSFVDSKTGKAVQFFTPGSKQGSVSSQTPVYKLEEK